MEHTEDATPGEVRSSEGLGLVEELRLIAAWHLPGGPYPGRRQPDKYKVCTTAAAEIERLLGERDVLLGVLRECDTVIATLEPESTDEDEALRTLLRTIKRLTLLRLADERDLLATHGA